MASTAARATRFLDAWEPGELIGHARLTQSQLDATPHGLDALFVAGDELFDYAFRPEDGVGNDLAGAAGSGVGSLPNARRVHAGEFRGPDAFSWASCHFLGGPDGAGTNTQNAYLRSDGDGTVAADVRNPPHVLGLGPVAALAREMTAELQGQRTAALLEAVDAPVVVALSTKDVTFGHLTAHPNGAVDTSEISGVDPDLVVRPFGWKGHRATLRVAFAVGQTRFQTVGCADCHRPRLELRDPILVDTIDNPALADHPPTRIDVARDGEAPKPEPKDAQESAFVVHLFSDLKRHDMGPGLATPSGQGAIEATWFLTRPLWGMADTAPYLHDGRAPTVHDAVAAHGGEAAATRDAYFALPADEQRAISVYLLSLTRQPRLFVP